MWDEFGALQIAVVHDGRNAVDVSMDDWHELLSPLELAAHPETGPSSSRLLREQLRRLERVLTDLDVVCVGPDPLPDAYGQAFTRDPCFVVGDRLFVGAPADPWRFCEVHGLGPIRRRCPQVTDLAGTGVAIEGGDVFVLDGATRVVVGTHRHTNLAGIQALRRALAASGTEVISVPHAGLHLDCCLAPLPSGDALIAAERFGDASMDALSSVFRRLIPLDPAEGLGKVAANMLWLDARRVVSNAATPRTNEVLAARGYEVIAVECTELTALWGGVRCAVCPLHRASRSNG